MSPPVHAWHPLAVHLPLIGFLAAAGFDVLDAWSAVPRFRAAATVLWCVALAGAGVAVATGLWAYTLVDHSNQGHVIMTRHRNMALGASAIFVSAAIWRWRQPRSKGAATLALAGLAVLIWVGDLGADLVYQHALGLSTPRLSAIVRERAGDLLPPAPPGIVPSMLADSFAVPPHRPGAPAKQQGHTHEPGHGHGEGQ